MNLKKNFVLILFPFIGLTLVEQENKLVTDTGVLMAGFSKTDITFAAARIADYIAFTGYNVEMLTEIGNRIREASPFKYTLVITHCNGYSGYLVPAELSKKGGFEVSSTLFKIGSSKMIAEKHSGCCMT